MQGKGIHSSHRASYICDHRGLYALSYLRMALWHGRRGLGVASHIGTGRLGRAFACGAKRTWPGRLLGAVLNWDATLCHCGRCGLGAGCGSYVFVYIYNYRNRTHYPGYNGLAGRCVQVVGSGLVYILCVIYIYNYTHRQSTYRLYNAGPRVRRVRSLVSGIGYVYIL